MKRFSAVMGAGLLALAVSGFVASSRAAQVAPRAVTADPPRDAAHPAGMAYVQVPSHGILLNGVVYTAAGAGPHPTVLLLHGFPGNEQNLDLAQAIRRAGFNVLTLHYRGSWGSLGVFSFGHAIEDADAAVAFLRDPAVDARLGLDPNRLYAAGHSMGGFMAASAAAHDSRIAGLIMISAWSIGGADLPPAAFREDVIPLAGATAESLQQEIEANRQAWRFAGWASQLKSRAVLLITAEDGSATASHALADALKRAGDKDVTEIHMVTDHPYSDHRIALESAVVEWLGRRAAPSLRR